MCTLIVIRNVDPQYRLIVAANRDESPTRPTADPAERPGGIYAPLDLVHGGSWIGVNGHGVVAALTNRFLAPRFRGRRSRGLLVTEALAARTTAEAVAAIRSQPDGTYNGFQLVIDDGREAALVWSDAGACLIERLTDGIRVFTGDDDLPGRSVREKIVRERLEDDWFYGRLGHLQKTLSFHGPHPEDGTCVHGPDVTMESVFSMIVRRPIGRDALDVHWRSGRPCRGSGWNRHEVNVTPQTP